MTRGVLLDLAGVLYDGDHAIDGSVEAINRLTAAGIPFRVITNSTRSPRRKLLLKLEKMGFRISDDQLFTPARAACDLLALSGHKAHLLIHPDLAEDFPQTSDSGAGISVIIGDAAQFFTYDAMNAAFRALTKGADLVALANNRSFSDADGNLSIDMGAYVAALEYASGKQATVLGKPSPAFFNAALASMGVTARDAVMIGDDAEADVAGALSAGIGRGILVRTGKYRKGEEHRYAPSPHHVADTLSDAVTWLLTQG